MEEEKEENQQLDITEERKQRKTRRTRSRRSRKRKHPDADSDIDVTDTVSPPTPATSVNGKQNGGFSTSTPLQQPERSNKHFVFGEPNNSQTKMDAIPNKEQTEVERNSDSASITPVTRAVPPPKKSKQTACNQSSPSVVFNCSGGLPVSLLSKNAVKKGFGNFKVFDRHAFKKKSNFSMSQAEQISQNDEYTNKSFVFTVSFFFCNVEVHNTCTHDMYCFK